MRRIFITGNTIKARHNTKLITRAHLVLIVFPYINAVTTIHNNETVHNIPDKEKELARYEVALSPINIVQSADASIIGNNSRNIFRYISKL